MPQLPYSNKKCWFKIFGVFFILELVAFSQLFPKGSALEKIKSHFTGVENAMASEQTHEQSKRVFKIKEILDGNWPHPTIEIAYDSKESGVPVTGVDAYSPPPKPANPEAIHMVLAFQMTLGKGRKDFAEFKTLDAPWVASNNGSNAATIWTERQGDWVFDAFEDVVFASKADFEKAYAGNDELGKAAEGLFGDKVLVAIVEEVSK